MVETYQRRPDADVRMRSAIAVIEALLPLNIYPWAEAATEAVL